jgi:hypothetical protein
VNREPESKVNKGAVGQSKDVTAQCLNTEQRIQIEPTMQWGNVAQVWRFLEILAHMLADIPSSVEHGANL